jgi:hypothetical protein
MPVDHLLFESLLPGKTLAEDRQNKCCTSADLKAAPNETVLLFRLDDERTRKRLGLAGSKCCDHLYLFKSLTHAILIFVELKSTDLKDAADQIVNAFEAVKAQSSYGRTEHPPAIALIISSSAPPRDSKMMQKQLMSRGLILVFGTSRGRACYVREKISDFLK